MVSDIKSIELATQVQVLLSILRLIPLFSKIREEFPGRKLTGMLDKLEKLLKEVPKDERAEVMRDLIPKIIEAQRCTFCHKRVTLPRIEWVEEIHIGGELSLPSEDRKCSERADQNSGLYRSAQPI